MNHTRNKTAAIVAINKTFSRIRDAKMGNSLFNQSKKPPEVASTIRFEESISAEVHSRPSKTMKTIQKNVKKRTNGQTQVKEIRNPEYLP